MDSPLHYRSGEKVDKLCELCIQNLTVSLCYSKCLPLTCHHLMLEPRRVMTVAVRVYLLTAADVNLGLARQKAAVSSLLLTTVQGGFRLGGCQR